MKEDFQRLWEYHSPTWAGKFLDEWCTQTMRSKIELMKIVARTFRGKRELILNWFRAGGTISVGIVEGFNNKLKLITRKSYGFGTQTAYETALYHNLGALPEQSSPTDSSEEAKNLAPSERTPRRGEKSGLAPTEQPTRCRWE